MARFLLLVLFLVVAWVGSASALEVPGLPADAESYEQQLRRGAPPEPLRKAIDEELQAARQAKIRGDEGAALKSLEKAINLGDERPETWLALSDTWRKVAKPDAARALQAAWLAYSADEPSTAARALWMMAAILDEDMDRPRQAQSALDDLARREPNFSGLSARLIDLRRRVGLEVQRLAVDIESDQPRACITFSAPLREARGFRYEDFVAVEPPAPLFAETRDRELCLGGLEFGQSYQLVLREGLPGADDVRLRQSTTQTVIIGDRKPSASFRGNAFILPRHGPEGVPITTVNVDAVRLKLYRVNERNLAPLANRRQLLRALSRDETDAGESADWEEGEDEEGAGARDRFANEDGELIWQGRMDVVRERNKAVVTGVPVRQLVGSLRPGFYVLAAEPADLPARDLDYLLATQWLVISDLGLTVLRGADGIDVFVRSLATAKPLAGVPVSLVARNNAEPARIDSDADGRVHFSVGTAGAGGGNRPKLVMAFGPDGDFAVLDLERAAFDLSDRGVDGRRQPGPLDAFVYTDRGVYRPGEPVNLGILLRDDRARAASNVPLTLKILRPNGTVFRRDVVASSGDGGHTTAVRLSETAPFGTWSVEAFADPEADPIGRSTFQVEDFVPERLAVEASGDPALVPDRAFELTVNSRFLYGPPAAGLTGRVEVSVAVDERPFPDLPGYRFGLTQEAVTPRTVPFDLPPSDATGVSRLALQLPSLPDTTRPLKADMRITVAEPGGRPSRAGLTVPVRAQSLAIGVRPRFKDGRIDEGGEAAFDVVAVAADGRRVARAGLAVELLREDIDFQWYRQNGRWAYRSHVRSRSARRSTTDATEDRPASIELASLGYGRYRLEVSDKESGAATSVRFVAGWQPALDRGDTPDTLEVAADRSPYRIGDTARLHIKPPFAGEAVVAVATDRVVTTRTVTVPAEGVDVALPVTEAWGTGAYAIVSLTRPASDGARPLPVRAVGVAWMAIDPAERTLGVELRAGAPVRPRTRIEVPVRVTDSGGAPVPAAFVTVAAVDEGILRLTDFASPDPVRHYLGKRLLGVEVRDDYGRLIRGLAGPFGATRQGGDTGGVGLPQVPLTIVSLFQGPLRTDARGMATASFDVPDFNGELRLMAVAYDARRVGAAANPLTVRDPLVAELILPRFLAPDDDSRATISIHNIEAEAGLYRVAVAGDGAVEVAGAASGADLDRGERRSLVFPLKGVTAGTGRVTVSVAGPGGFALERSLAMTVRPPQPPRSDFVVSSLAPGAASDVTLASTPSFLPGTVDLRVMYSSRPPFDVAGLAIALDRYPYGCLEQVVSRSLPLLVMDDAVAPTGGQAAVLDRKARILAGIGQVLDKQRFDGSFGVWSAFGEERPWLTAYAAEFLVRARDRGHAVPDAPLLAALDWLRRHAVDGGSSAEDLASRAYAVHVLGLAGVLTPGPARYIHDTFLDRLPTPLSRAQLAAALTRLGDRERARAATDKALASFKRDFWYADYGSTVRDVAAALTLLAEVGQLGDAAPALMDRLPRGRAVVAETNTQEQAWLLLAARALAGEGPALALTRDGKALRPADPYHVVPTAAELGRGLRVVNAGKGAIWQAVSVSGVPVGPLPATREGLAIRREFLTRDGQPLDLDGVRQNDVFLIVLKGEASTGISHEALITHLLPAGWEIENPALGGETAARLPWLGELTKPKAIAARDDRFAAAVDLSEAAPSFRLAFLVRAVTPGSYALPGAYIEDMYRPRFFARQAVGRITVLPVP